MKVLFVSSGNSRNGISPIVKRQGESLKRLGVELYYFTIKGKGFKGYLSNLNQLRILLHKIKPDIVHAHYSMSAFLATLAGARPLIVSLMGSDVKSSNKTKFVIKVLHKYFWHNTIVKSEDMRNNLELTNAFVIPNGVDTDEFFFREKTDCQKQLGWELKKKHILFAANPSRPEKNFALAKQAFSLVEDTNIVLHSLIDVAPEQIPLWMNASDVVLLTSLWEGSPNVIKEAMACNCPVVTVDVGDVKKVIGNTPGCFVCSFNANEIAERLMDVIKSGQRTTGREHILNLGLSSTSIAASILKLYQGLIKVSDN